MTDPVEALARELASEFDALRGNPWAKWKQVAFYVLQHYVPRVRNQPGCPYCADPATAAVTTIGAGADARDYHREGNGRLVQCYRYGLYAAPESPAFQPPPIPTDYTGDETAKFLDEPALRALHERTLRPFDPRAESGTQGRPNMLTPCRDAHVDTAQPIEALAALSATARLADRVIALEDQAQVRIGHVAIKSALDAHEQKLDMLGPQLADLGSQLADMREVLPKRLDWHVDRLAALETALATLAKRVAALEVA